MKVLTCLPLIFLIAACSSPARVSCADPAERIYRLDEGSTFRDLAKSRAEALAGWEQCHRAVDRAKR